MKKASNQRRKPSVFAGLTCLFNPVTLAIGLFCLVILASEKPSLALLTQGETDPSNFSVAGLIDSLQLPQIANSSDIIDAAIEDSQKIAALAKRAEEKESLERESELELMHEARQLFAHYHSRREQPTINIEKAVQYHGLVEFLSGMIAAYYPKESDPKTIARQIVQVSLEEDADPIYIAALIASESSFRKNARSHVGARGLMQLMPSTARIVAKRTNFPNKPLVLTDPKTNIRLGIRYIQQLEKEYRGNRFKALAAYNWGPGNVGKASKRGTPYPRSVRAYANKIIKRRGKWDLLFKDEFRKQYARTR